MGIKKIYEINKKHINFYFLGLVILTSILFPFFSHTYIANNDYITQHIPFYTEFYRLLNEGLPFWSWNGFLGLNFFASKTYYLIGDPYAWLSIIIHFFISSVPKILSILLLLKFIVSYTNFFILTKFWNIHPIFRIILSLSFALSGWNLMFIEQTMFTSFYSLIPLLLIGLELYFEKKSFYLLIFSVFILLTTNFYFFWMASWLFLFYYLFRYIDLYKFNLKEFIFTSLKLFFAFLSGTMMSALIWLPGLLHLLQSGRVGTFLNTFNEWNSLEISSFITYTLIPNLRTNGLFKDIYYYFYQVSFYVGTYVLLIIPQNLSDKNQNKTKCLALISFIMLLLLIVNPNIGIFFNFSYSLRYTLIHTFFLIFLAAQSFKNIELWKVNVAIISQIFITLIYFLVKLVLIPKVFNTPPTDLLEYKLLNLILLLSWLYTFVIILIIKLNNKKRKSILLYVFFTLSIFEISYISYQNLNSSQGTGLIYYNDDNFVKALNYIKEYDQSFYRIYTNNEMDYYNLSYSYDFMSIKSYDSMYQYPLQKFLNLVREYPYIHWGFDLHEFSILEQVAVKYEIVKDDELTYPNGLYMATKIALDQDFGPYSIYRYEYPVAFGKTYTKYDEFSTFDNVNIEAEGYFVYLFTDALRDTVYLDTSNIDLSSLKNTNVDHQYIQPSTFYNNYIELYFTTNEPSILVLNMPYDDGWTIKDNSKNIKTFSVQGGFMGLYIESGVHNITMKFIPNGLIMGALLSISSFIILIGLKLMRRFKNR